MEENKISIFENQHVIATNNHFVDINKIIDMKLYTEENVLQMLRSFCTLEINVKICMLRLTPIELPSDEEIRERAENVYLDDSLSAADEYENGAKWMIEQIIKNN